MTQALALGVLQGATEFLPVSSSGHLALAENWLQHRGPSELLFDVVVHLGTLLAIVFVLRRRVAALLRAATGWLPASWLPRVPRGSDSERRWLLLLAAGSLPTALIGLGLRDTVRWVHDTPWAIGACLVVTAAILVVGQRFGRRRRGADELGLADALWIGTVQGLAVLPGISRSGATVATGLLRDLSAGTAVEFSMLVSLPAIVGANLLEFTLAGGEAVRAEWLPLAVGFAAAFASGALGLRALQIVVARRRLLPFAAYCALLGSGAIALG